MQVSVPPGWGRTGFTVVIPARDEEGRLPRALAALAAQGPLDAIVVANGCTDATARVARGDRPGLAVATIETGALTGGVGAARRLGMALALDRAPGSILATTDADCRVCGGWIGANRAALSRADAACGRVEPDPVDFMALPPLVRAHGRLEACLADLVAQQGRIMDPVPHDPWPSHTQTPGASLAFTAAAYLASGGFEPVPCHEDRRLIARMEERGLRVARPANARVVASCRTAGRAPGGMADTIASRVADTPRLVREMAAMRSEIARLRGMLKTGAAGRAAGAAAP